MALKSSNKWNTSKNIPTVIYIKIVHKHTCMDYIYVYIYRERERERKIETNICMCTPLNSINIYTVKLV